MPFPASFASAAADPAAWDDENRTVGALIAAARAGEPDGFDALYDATARWMLSIVRRLVPGSDAEDVLAEAYLQVWNSLDSYDPARGPPRVWLAMIARSRALDHLRREKRRWQVHVAQHLQCGSDEAHAEGPEHLLSREQQARLVRLALRGPALTSDERAVLGLAYFRDSTQQEIATLTGWPLGTVKTVMRRAQDKLRTGIAVADVRVPSSSPPGSDGASA